MLRRKENYHSKAECFSFCLLILLFCYIMPTVTRNTMLSSRLIRSEVTTHCRSYLTIPLHASYAAECIGSQQPRIRSYVSPKHNKLDQNDISRRFPHISTLTFHVICQNVELVPDGVCWEARTNSTAA